MAFTDILEDGFGIWRNNLKLAVPFLLNALAQILLMIIVGGIGVVVLIFMGLGVGALGPSKVLSFFSNLSFTVLAVIGLILAVLSLLFLAIQWFINAFFVSGAIGMSKNAVNGKDTEISTMIDVGKDQSVSLFIALVITKIILVLPIVVLLLVFGGLKLTGSLSGTVALLIVVPLFLLALAYWIILGIAFAPVPYAVVLSDFAPIEGVKKGVSFALDHKLYVFLLWILLIIIQLTFMGVQMMVRFGTGLISDVLGAVVGTGCQLIFALITVLIVSPLFTVFWTYLYMEKKEMSMKETGLDDVDETLDSLRNTLGMDSNEDIPAPEPRPLRENDSEE